MSSSTNSTQSSQLSSIGGHYHHHHHHHHHVHHHGHSHHHGLAKANKDFYNEHVDIYGTYPHAKERAKRTALAIVNAVPLNKETSTVLEFACGTGMVAKELLPSVKAITGVDISEEAVKHLNAEFEKEGVQDRCKAIATNLETDQSGLEGRTFDLVYCASAYHHFGNPEAITKLLSSLIKPSGTLVAVDNYITEDVQPPIEEKYKHIVARSGFTEKDMKKLFEDAGVKLDKYEIIPRDEGDNDIFIAKGVKA